jgi:hypothetical protein
MRSTSLGSFVSCCGEGCHVKPIGLRNLLWMKVPFLLVLIPAFSITAVFLL